MRQFPSSLSLLAVLLLSACDKPSSPATETAAAAGGGSVEVVQLKRQDPVGQTLALPKVGYEICKISADMLKKPVKPFPPTPAGYGETRITTVTNGTSMVTKEETAFEDSDELMTPETGCEYQIKPSKLVSIQIDHDGKLVQMIGEGSAPPKVTETTDGGDAPEWSKGNSTTTEYTEARTVNGVPLRCLPKDYWILNTNKHLDMREMCVYAKDGVVVDQMREPIILLSHAMINIINEKHKYTDIVEPVSVRVIGKGESDPYQAATWSK